jgi:acyl carrier protein
MEKTQIENKIKEIIIEKLNLEEAWNTKVSDIESNTPLFDGGLGLSSVAALEIIVGIESEFDIEFVDTEINFEILYNVENLAEHVMNKKTIAN